MTWWRARRRSGSGDPGLVQLVRTTSAPEAHLIAGLLNGHGVDAAAVDLGVDVVFTGQPLGGRVLVRAEDLAAAQAVLAASPPVPDS